MPITKEIHFVASTMCDLFTTSKGELFKRDFQGSFLLERVRNKH